MRCLRCLSWDTMITVIVCCSCLKCCCLSHTRVPAQTPRLSRAEGTHALVIAPTRELCLQIHDVAMLLLKKYFWLVRLCVCVACSHC